jgi:hypothetical protein
VLVLLDKIFLIVGKIHYHLTVLETTLAILKPSVGIQRSLEFSILSFQSFLVINLHSTNDSSMRLLAQESSYLELTSLSTKLICISLDRSVYNEKVSAPPWRPKV